jgi:prepilin-type N-terminal cleavage/methylation domain-containing protein/prepilin-type processing-associated H-X9-DG protein
MSQRRHAFTLIELLVVIAIIAILAAILFPVFAQAREKARQTTCLSNQKQIGLGILMYSQDYDELYPLAKIQSVAGGAWSGGYVTTPPDWRTPTAANVAFRSLFWANSIQPYLKNGDLYKCPSGANFTVTSTAAALKPTYKMSYVMNGFLTQYPQAGINQTAATVLMWEGSGKAAVDGFSSENPTLNCPTGTENCVYVAKGTACATGNGGTGGMYGPEGSMYVHNNGINLTFADGHVKYRRLGAVVGAATDGNVDPFTNYNASGFPTSFWNNGCHAWLFRPDFAP